MGQYFKGKKIGTCEDMYYMNLEEAKKLADLGFRDDDGIAFSEYINDNQTRWRFPWPGELSEKDTRNGSHDTTFILPISDMPISHRNILLSSSDSKGERNINISLPCPNSSEFKKIKGISITSHNSIEQFVAVSFQAMRLIDENDTGVSEMKEKTIFACARCGHMQIFKEVGIAHIRQRSLEYFEPYNMTGKSDYYMGGNQAKYDYAKKIIELIK